MNGGVCAKCGYRVNQPVYPDYDEPTVKPSQTEAPVQNNPAQDDDLKAPKTGESSLMMLYGVILLILLISWKNFQLRSSQRQLPQGMKECTYEFDEEEIICTTAAGEQRYSYEQVFAVVSDMAWYVIFFDASHGIILDKNGFSVGDARDFKAFIGQHTQLPIQEY